jgi:hypothetical protein
LPRRLTLLADALVIAIAAPVASAAQSVQAKPAYVLESWTVRDGLPVNVITSLLQGRDGYLWIGTFDGLVRFDGVRFTTFNAANSPGLPTSRIVDLKRTSDGSLWLTTEQNELVRFRKDTFTLVDERRSTAMVPVMSEDRHGTMSIGTTKGLGVIRDDRLVPILEATIRDSVSAIVQRHDGSMLVTTYDAVFRAADAGWRGLVWHSQRCGGSRGQWLVACLPRQVFDGWNVDTVALRGSRRAPLARWPRHPGLLDAGAPLFVATQDAMRRRDRSDGNSRKRRWLHAVRLSTRALPIRRSRVESTTHRRLGKLYDQQGNATKAIEHYEWFANAWKNAAAEQQPTVRAVRARTTALRSTLAPG